MGRKRMFIALLGAQLLLGCMTAPAALDGQRLAQLQPGVSTLSQVEALIGLLPRRILVLPSGATEVHWRNQAPLGPGGEQEVREAGLLFGANGRFERILNLKNIQLSDEQWQRLSAVGVEPVSPRPASR
ncbi:MAG: hypothetical protein ABWY06_06805 [Pseudomonas sp.]|uniref:hypothetical protein n=1 Tax=Pseudomonas sp. TaxID=306 RepID=UPI00339A4524